MKFFEIFLLCCMVQLAQQRIIKTKNESKQKESKKADFIFDQKRPQIIVQPHGDIDQMYSKTSRIKFGEVPELKPQPIQQNYPLFQMDEKNGLGKFGALAADLFKISPDDILSENEMHDSLDQFKDSIEESKMKYPILIPPTILKSMVFYLRKIDYYKQKEKEKEELKQKDKNSVNLTKEQLQEKEIEERMSNNAEDMRHIEQAIIGLTDKVAKLRAQKQHQEEQKEEEERLAKLKREQEAEQKKQAILLQEAQIQEDIIRVEKEEIELENSDVDMLESEKKKLEQDLQKLIAEEASSDKIAQIEKLLEELDTKIQKKEENLPENKMQQLLAEKEQLMLEEEKEAQRFVTEEVASIEGDLTSSQMKFAKDQIKTLKELLEKLFEKLPSKNKLIYKNDNDAYLKLVIDMHNFQRLFQEYFKFVNTQIKSQKTKMQKIELNTEGIVTYLERNDVYVRIKKKTYPNDAKIFNWDSKLQLFSDRLSEAFKLYINNLQVILNSFTSVQNLLNNANLNDEKQNLMSGEEMAPITEETYITKRNIIEQIHESLTEAFIRVRKILDNFMMMKETEGEMKLTITKMSDYINQKENIQTVDMEDRQKQEEFNKTLAETKSSNIFRILIAKTFVFMMLF